MAAPQFQADLIRVDKPARRMQLLRQGQPIREYPIALGADPAGHKQREGDERTPEGRYVIDWRNDKYSAHLSLHISYPSPADAARAAAASEPPGGQRHDPRHDQWLGLSRRAASAVGLDGWLHRRDQRGDREIWSLVPDGTPIEING